jgi:hypothetical protein
MICHLTLRKLDHIEQVLNSSALAQVRFVEDQHSRLR